MVASVVVSEDHYSFSPLLCSLLFLSPLSPSPSTPVSTFPSPQDTVGTGINERGGAIYVLEWDPYFGAIKTWVFPNDEQVPDNLVAAMNDEERPDPRQWQKLPYGNFPIGPKTGCSSDHFRDMHLVINTAFCGSVAANKFKVDCPALAEEYGTCEAYVASNPKALEDAFWDFEGVWVFERDFEEAEDEP